MADDYEQTLAEANKATEQFARSLRSTIRPLVKLAGTEANREKVLKFHLKQQEQLIKLTQDELKQGKITKEHADKNIKGFKQQIKATKDLQSEFKITTNAVTDFGENISRSWKRIDESLAKAPGSIFDTTKMFLDAGQQVAGLGEAFQHIDIPFIGTMLKALGKTVDFNVDVYKSLAQSGATFGQSLFEMRTAAFDARMPLLKFQEIVSENTPTLAKLFGTVNSSIPRLTGFTRSLRNITEQEFAQFGLTLDDTSEFLTTYLELERARGAASRLSDAEVLAGTRAYTKQLIELSRLTGLSVKDLDAQNKSLAMNGIFQASMAKRGPEEAKRLGNLITMLGGAESGMGKFAQEMFALDQPISETSRLLQSLSDGAIGAAIKAYENQEISLAEARERIAKSSNALLNSGLEAAATLNPAFASVVDAAAQQAGAETGLADKVKTETEARGDNIKAMVNATSQLDSFKSVMEKVTTDTLQPLLMGEGAANISGKIGKGFDAIEGFVGANTNPYKLLGKAIDSGKGAMRVISGTVSDAAKGTKEFFTKGADKKNIWDNLSWWDTKNEKMLKSDTSNPNTMKNFYSGSDGFQNFGTGTAAMLHGTEAVVPKDSLFGNALQIFENAILGTKNKTETVGSTTTAKTTSGVDSGYLVTLNDTAKQIASSSQKVETHLNTLITIGAMTERNTKSAKQTLANFGGSLV